MGHDIEIGNTTTTSADACQKACAAKENCLYFSFQKTTNTCRMNSEQGSIIQTKDDFTGQRTDFISGPRQCLDGK